MATKTITFEELPAPDIDLELEYTYYFKEGKYFGRPEDCYPDEEEMEIVLPKGFEETVMNRYIAAAREAIKKIESKVQDFEFDNMPRQWAEEERKWSI